MTQLSFSDAEYTQKRKQTRCEKFLAEMEHVVPWVKLEQVIEPHYPKPGNGRRPYPLSTMLRVHCLQQWYALSDPAAEDALYEITSMRQFAGLSLNGPIPDETTILNFRRLLETHQLAESLFAEVNNHLKSKGLLLREGTLVDATIINAPPSTKNARRQRDPDMASTRKGNQWYFGMKAHIGVDVDSGIVHSLTGTAANVHDINEAHHLLHGEEQFGFGDAGYTGVEKRDEMANVDITWHIAMKRGERRKLRELDTPDSRLQDSIETLKSQIRAKVEHPFRIIKRQFGYQKTRYRGLRKNTQQLFTLFALSNLYGIRRELL